MLEQMHATRVRSLGLVSPQFFAFHSSMSTIALHAIIVSCNMTPIEQPQDLPDPSALPALEVDSASEPMSRTPTGSSVLDNESIQEYGRTWHYKPNKYFLPNDGDEQERLDIQHKVQCLLMDDELHKAPLSPHPEAVLDLGTGTGIWAIQFAKQYPDCRVIGSDLSLIQPQGVTPNVEFIREDAEGDEWTYKCSFDYIHARMFSPFLVDIGKVMRNVFEHLKPGGWIELQEMAHETMSSDGSLDGTAFKTISSTWTAIMAKNGQNPWVTANLKQIVTDAGFTNVVEHVQYMPIGAWPKDPRYREIGRWHAVNFYKALGAAVKALVHSGMTEGQVKHLVAEAQEELRSGKMHAYQLYYVVYGRKPESESS